MTTQREAFEKYAGDDWDKQRQQDAFESGFQAALSQPNEPVTLLALKNTQLQKRIDLLEDLLTSAHNIANRNGADTHWLRFAGQLHVNGISCVTAKTFKILPSDDNYSAPPSASELEQANKALEGKIVKLTTQVNILEELQDEYLDEIADLTAKLEKMREAYESQQAEITRLTAIIKENEADAKRYRHMRKSFKETQFNNVGDYSYPRLVWHLPITRGLTFEQRLDESIDGAMRVKGEL